MTAGDTVLTRVAGALRAARDDVRRGRDDRTRPGRSRGEDGFILLESLIAISLIAVVMGALASMTLNVVTGTNELRARQAATQLATSAMAAIGAVPSTDLATGRDPAGVAAQFSAASARVRPWLVGMTPVTDDTPGLPAGSGATATVPTSPVTQTLNSIAYSVSTYLGRCVMRSRTAGECEVSGTGTAHLRAVVAVSWTGRGCRSGTCTYLTATLVNPAADPVFNTNRATPPSKPVVANPGPQTSTRGSTVSVRLAVVAGTGLAPLTWQVTTGALPVGLTLSADGLVSGSPTTVAPATPLTVTVRDAFGRTATGDLTWRVVAPPTIQTPVDQTAVVGRSLTLATSSTCPNSPCTFTLAGAPPGLGIDTATGVISGTPTAAGTSAPVTVTVTDAGGVAATTSPFTWRVLQPATIATPGPLRATVGTSVSVPVTYTCPAGPCTVTLSGTAPGVGLSTSTPVTVNNQTASVDVAAGTGTLYLAGTLQAGAVPTGTSRDYAPVLRISSPGSTAVVSGAGAWTIYTPPTLGPVGDRNIPVGATRDVAVAFTCPLAPCTVTLPSTVPGIGLSLTPGQSGPNATTSVVVSGTSGTVYVSGRVADSAAPSGRSRSWPVSVTSTDAGGAAVTSSGTWTATTAPRITNPGSQALEPNRGFDLPLEFECPNGGCTWRADRLFLGFIPIPLSISSSGRITAGSLPSGSYPVRVIVTDSEGLTDTVTFQVTVQGFTLSMPNLVSTRGDTATYSVAGRVDPQADGYTYSLSGAPGWLSMGPDGTITATPGPGDGSTGNNLRVTVTSTASPQSTVSSNNFRWSVQ